jgi:hypothetical protein
MSRLPVTEFSKGVDYTKVSNSVKTERNRLVSWGSPVQELTKPAVVIPSPRNAITLKPLEFVSKVTKLILATLVKLPYTLFKLGYEIAKLVTRGLSRIRRLLFVAK